MSSIATKDWMFRVGNGKNFKASSKFQIWGIKSSTNFGKHFVKNVKPGDRIWFIKANSNGLILGVAIYRSHNYREFGPLVDSTMTDEELGWDDTGENCDIEVHYSELRELEDCGLLTHIKFQGSIVEYKDNCKINLPVEYSYISRYRKISA
jgi:hypothetical protein